MRKEIRDKVSKNWGEPKEQNALKYKKFKGRMNFVYNSQPNKISSILSIFSSSLSLDLYFN